MAEVRARSQAPVLAQRPASGGSAAPAGQASGASPAMRSDAWTPSDREVEDGVRMGALAVNGLDGTMSGIGFQIGRAHV